MRYGKKYILSYQQIWRVAALPTGIQYAHALPEPPANLQNDYYIPILPATWNMLPSDGTHTLQMLIQDHSFQVLENADTGFPRKILPLLQFERWTINCS